MCAKQACSKLAARAIPGCALMSCSVTEHAADLPGCGGAQLSTYKVIRRGAKGGEVMSPEAGRGSKDSAKGSAGHHPADGHPEEPCFEEAQETWMLSEFCDRGAPARRPSLMLVTTHPTSVTCILSYIEFLPNQHEVHYW